MAAARRSGESGGDDQRQADDHSDKALSQSEAQQLRDHVLPPYRDANSMTPSTTTRSVGFSPSNTATRSPT